MNSGFAFSVRAFCLILSLIVGLLSYRSTTAILGLMGQAHNPTEGAIPTHREQVDVRENKPRPSRDRLPTSPLRVREQERNAAADPILRRIALLQDAAAELCCVVRNNPEPAHRAESTRPQYLHLFMPATPGSPHSPPV
jgi:hypothetical protein